MLKKSIYILFVLSSLLFSQESSYLQGGDSEVKLPQDKTIVISSDEDSADNSKPTTYLQ